MTFKQLREARGISQGEMARRSGVLQATISRIEVGAIANPRYDTMIKIASVLGMSPEVLHLAITESVKQRVEMAS